MQAAFIIKQLRHIDGDGERPLRLRELQSHCGCVLPGVVALGGECGVLVSETRDLLFVALNAIALVAGVEFVQAVKVFVHSASPFDMDFRYRFSARWMS